MAKCEVVSSVHIILLLSNKDANPIKNISGEKSAEDLSIMFLNVLLSFLCIQNYSF